MRLIDADEVLRAIERREKICIPCQDGKVYITVDCLKTFINNRPTVDAEKHAYWIHTSSVQYCSNCDQGVDNDDNQDAFRFKYCPWCGAKIEEDK